MTKQEIANKIIAVGMERSWKNDHFGAWAVDEWLCYLLLDEDHGLAKALWPGTIRRKHTCNYPDCTDEYEEIPLADHHLQRMVIAPDPISYLGANI
jgi:hypothetical protein